MDCTGQVDLLVRRCLGLAARAVRRQNTKVRSFSYALRGAKTQRWLCQECCCWTVQVQPIPESMLHCTAVMIAVWFRGGHVCQCRSFKQVHTAGMYNNHTGSVAVCSSVACLICRDRSSADALCWPDLQFVLPIASCVVAFQRICLSSLQQAAVNAHMCPRKTASNLASNRRWRLGGEHARLCLQEWQNLV